MNKAEFVEEVYRRNGDDVPSKAAAARVVDTCLAIIEEQLVAGGNVRFVGFGTFDKVVREARMMKNPQTKEMMQVPSKNAVRFSASKSLKDAINNQ